MRASVGKKAYAWGIYGILSAAYLLMLLLVFGVSNRGKIVLFFSFATRQTANTDPSQVEMRRG
ncbi:hypothetical protein [Ensifer sp. ENS12]|uniref:hypothetical protein n=1 Tax=Ensifer sp. ENS12 TaxID=2854774 RepID=UPI0013AFFE6E|nr:hypothetical protein [Ensifer sp. ENS12]MBV7521384.1 hypothetical protein [Ensifer sp. ENS12]